MCAIGKEKYSFFLDMADGCGKQREERRSDKRSWEKHRWSELIYWRRKPHCSNYVQPCRQQECDASVLQPLWVSSGSVLWVSVYTIHGKPSGEIRRDNYADKVRTLWDKKKRREIFLSYQKSRTDVDKQRQRSEFPSQKVSQRSFTNHRNQRVVNFSPLKADTSVTFCIGN